VSIAAVAISPQTADSPAPPHSHGGAGVS